MTKQAYSAAEDNAEGGRELVPAGTLEEVPAHVKARPIPRISTTRWWRKEGLTARPTTTQK